MQSQTAPSSGSPIVRLSPRDASALRAAFKQVLAPLGAARVYLFGSRIHPGERGGDIDLLVRLEHTPARPLTALTRQLRLAIFSRLEQQKIDIVWDLPGSSSPFAALAGEGSVEIWSTEDPS
jgi:predicted nucleotidyltransferase